MASKTLTPAARASLTPVKQTAISPVAKDSPGNWRHPRLAEITRRRSRTIFSEKNAKQIAYNAAALGIVMVVRGIVRAQLPDKL